VCAALFKSCVKFARGVKRLSIGAERMDSIVAGK